MVIFRKINIFVIIITLFCLFSGATVFATEYANPQLLVTPADIEKNKDRWVVLDCRDSLSYKEGHIPGAINLGEPCGKILRDTTLRVKKASDLENILGNSGISTDKPIVVYADAKLITSATVAFWVLEYLGHENVYFLNGGIEAWRAAGKQLEKTTKTLPSATFKSNIIKNRLATSDEVSRIARGEIKNVTLIDSRTEKEHKGNDIRSLRGGHIPNTTLNVSHTETYHVESGSIYSADGLNTIFGNLDKSKRTIAYCQTGTRSTLTYLELRLMGFKDPANYDDSWIIYGSNINYPVVNENWYDFVKVNEALKKIDNLTREINELKHK